MLTLNAWRHAHAESSASQHVAQLNALHAVGAVVGAALGAAVGSRLGSGVGARLAVGSGLAVGLGLAKVLVRALGLLVVWGTHA